MFDDSVPVPECWFFSVSAERLAKTTFGRQSAFTQIGTVNCLSKDLSETSQWHSLTGISSDKIIEGR